MKQTLLKSIVLISIIFSSCSSDDSVPLGVYENGVFVINEGNFLEGDGSVTFYGRSSGTVDQTIFEGVNGVQLGDVVQSAFVDGDLTYLVVNNSNKVEVVNSYTYESELTISNVQLPRYMTVSGGTGYLTEWVSFSDPGRVSIVDLETGNVSSTVTVGFGAEDIEVIGNKIYVSNNFESSLSIVDTGNDNTVTSVTLTDGPKQMVIDVNGKLWIACAGGFDQSFSPLNNGAIHRLNPSTGSLEMTLELNANISGKLAIDPSGNNLYFYVGNEVFMHNINDTNLSNNGEALITVDDATSLYGIGVDPATGVIYVADSKSFLEDGEVYRYQSNGTFIDSFSAGRGPNGFVFN